MAINQEIKLQLIPYLNYIKHDIVLKVYLGSDEASKDMHDFVQEIAELSDKVSVETAQLERCPSFAIDRIDINSGVVFAGLPLGHEFSSFVMALVQVSGHKPRIGHSLIEQIKRIDRKLYFTTYVNLSCQICPDIVQALNIMAVLNPNICNTTVVGSSFKEEVDSKRIMTVPTIYLNGEEFGGGRMTMEQILSRLGEKMPR